MVGGKRLDAEFGAGPVSELRDRCKCVLPDDLVTPGVPPWRVTPAGPDGLRAEYRCPSCLREWAVHWDRAAAGW